MTSLYRVKIASQRYGTAAETPMRRVPEHVAKAFADRFNLREQQCPIGLRAFVMKARTETK